MRLIQVNRPAVADLLDDLQARFAAGRRRGHRVRFGRRRRRVGRFGLLRREKQALVIFTCVASALMLSTISPFLTYSSGTRVFESTFTDR